MSVLFLPSASHWEPCRPQKGFTSVKMRESLHLFVIQIHTQKSGLYESIFLCLKPVFWLGFERFMKVTCKHFLS